MEKRTASFITGFKNDLSHELIDEEILKIHQVKSEKIKVKVYANQEKSLSLYRVSQKKLTALKCKLVAPNPIGTKHIK